MFKLRKILDLFKVTVHFIWSPAAIPSRRDSEWGRHQVWLNIIWITLHITLSMNISICITNRFAYKQLPQFQFQPGYVFNVGEIIESLVMSIFLFWWRPFRCICVCLQVNEEVSAEPTTDTELKDVTEAERREVSRINSCGVQVETSTTQKMEQGFIRL